jgi:hypothetical protein
MATRWTADAREADVCLRLLADIRAGCDLVPMQRTLTLQNEVADQLAIWIEPFCNPYRVPRGSKLTLIYDVSVERGGLIEMEANAEGLTYWFDTDYEPDALLDGAAILPL